MAAHWAHNPKVRFEPGDRNEVVSGVIMTLDGCKTWIENDEFTEEDEVEYTLTPVWLTEEEFKNIPEADI